MTGNSTIIGTRTITNLDGGSVEIIFYAPRIDEHGSYFCEFSLNGFSWTGRIRRTYGIDAIQALYLAMQSVGADLNELRRTSGCDLQWIGATGAGDLGFPSINT